MAFAELNPNASDDQLALFVNLYNASLASAYTGDSMLISLEHLIAAMRFTDDSDSSMGGLDTRVGEHALGLLGITIPDPDGFESIQRWMERYETALARPINQYRTEVYDLLVQAFYGQNPSGTDRPGLSMIMNDFLTNEGLDPAIGTLRADRPAVEAGLAGTYIDYQASISAGPMNNMLQMEVQTRLESVSTRIGELIALVDTTLGDTPEDGTSIQDGLDATQEEINAMLAQLQMVLEANNEARAAASAATMLMLQSQFDKIGDYASYTRDCSSITLETNDTVAITQSGLEIGRSLTNLALMADDAGCLRPRSSSGFGSCEVEGVVDQLPSPIASLDLRRELERLLVLDLLGNDVMQEFTMVLVDTTYELDPAYVAPQNGQVTLNVDGSLSYQADPGFVGTDSFTYLAMTTVKCTSNSVYSAPATVVIKVTDPACSPADLTVPYGELNFFDVSAFLVAFNCNDLSADFNEDGQFNFFDVSEFLTAFGLGCP